MRWLQKQGILFLILVLAVLLRLPLLGSSLWLDEAAQAMESIRPWSQQLQIVNDFQPPLMHLVVHILLQVSRAEWWLRLGAALVPALLTIAGTYVLGTTLWNKKVGALAAILLATSSFHIFYSQELRPYALPAMWAVWSWWCLWQWSHKVGQARSRHTWFIAGFVVATIAGIYTSYLYPCVVLAQISYGVIAAPHLRKKIFVIGGGSVLSFLPWLPMFRQQLQAGQTLRTTLPGWQEVVSFNQVKSLALTVGKFFFGIVSLKGVVWPFFAVILIAGFAILFYRLHRSTRLFTQKFWLILCWLLLPIGVAWLTSFIVPVLQPKRVLFALPALYLAIGYVTTLAVPPKRQKFVVPLQIFLIVVLLNINLFSVVSYYVNPQYHREDWRSMHAQVVAQYPAARSIAVFAFPAPFAPWQWYDDGHYPTLATGKLVINNVNDLAELRKITEYHYVLVFEYLRDLTDPHNLVLAEVEKYGYHEVDRITPQTPLGIVHVYARPETTISLK